MTGEGNGAFPHSKIGPDLQIRLRGLPDLRGWLMGLFLCWNYVKTAAVNKDVSEPQGLDSFPDSQAWVLGWEIAVWATPWVGSSWDLCAFLFELVFFPSTPSLSWWRFAGLEFPECWQEEQSCAGVKESEKSFWGGLWVQQKHRELTNLVKYL